jgi:hypothetical protein
LTLALVAKKWKEDETKNYTIGRTPFFISDAFCILVFIHPSIYKFKSLNKYSLMTSLVPGADRQKTLSIVRPILFKFSQTFHCFHVASLATYT